MLDLVTHDDAQPALPAVHLEGRTSLTYGELAESVGEFERALRRDGRALVLCGGDRDLPTLLAYLAALRLGHAVAFLPASAGILSAYQPEFVVPAPGSRAGLADLGYRPAPEPAAGATVFLRTHSRPAGESYTATPVLGATSFAGVPTPYSAFGSARARLLGRSKIRTMTQSGARLGDELTMRLARRMDQRDGRFFVMYGQSEVTSRTARLDPSDLPGRLGSVGTAVPGGTITIRPAAAHARAVPGEGAVHYRGPGVMLGYATSRADLSRGPEVDVLDTGDLRYLREGYLYLTGRTKRIVKVLGVRTSL